MGDTRITGGDVGGTVRLGVGDGLGVLVAVAVIVAMGVLVRVAVRVGVRVGVTDGVGVAGGYAFTKTGKAIVLLVGVGVVVYVGEGDTVSVMVGVAVSLAVAVGLGVAVGEGVHVSDGVTVGVGVGVGEPGARYRISSFGLNSFPHSYSLEQNLYSTPPVPSPVNTRPRLAVGFAAHWATRSVTSQNSQRSVAFNSVECSNVPDRSTPMAEAPGLDQGMPALATSQVASCSFQGLSS